MKQDRSFHDYVMQDVLKDVPGVASRAMFGGWGIYKNGTIFAIIAEGQLYFKVDDGNRPQFEQRGSSPFVYKQGKHKPVTMSYWTLPEDVMENQNEIHEWIEYSVQASLRGGKKKP